MIQLGVAANSGTSEVTGEHSFRPVTHVIFDADGLLLGECDFLSHECQVVLR